MIHYFGKWPEWSHLFFQSIINNTDVDFLIFTDNIDFPSGVPNVEIRKLEFQSYIAFVNKKISPIHIQPIHPYKLCDLKSLYGFLHLDDLINYNYYGWCDIDLIFGQIREFYADDVLSSNDVFSTHYDRLSGHFALFKKTNSNIYAYTKIYNWQEKLTKETYQHLDEIGLFEYYTMSIWQKMLNKLKIPLKLPYKRKGLCFKEQYTTPFIETPWLDGSTNSDQPDQWYYKDGKISNSRDQGRNFMYLHFMNFKSSKYRKDGSVAPWESKVNFCTASVADMMRDGISINSDGIRPLN